MKVCIFGAGAIGGYLAVQLAQTGIAVSCVARGPHLKAMRENGLRLLIGDEEKVVQVACSENPADLGLQDFVIMSLKAPGALAVADRLGPLMAEGTAVVTAQNGIPWWYFYKHGGPFDGTQLESVDPGGRQWNLIGPNRAIGSVVYPAAEVIAPGVVRHQYGNRIMLGEPDGSKSARALVLSKALTDAGLKAPVRPRLRDDIWLKLWGNLSFNPISALTHQTLEAMAADKPVHAIIRTMMVEAQTVGEALGIKFSVDVDTRIQWAADVGAHKTSMLQDLERSRAMEIDALVTVLREMGRITNIATPTIDVVLGLVQLRARGAGCYGT